MSEVLTDHNIIFTVPPKEPEGRHLYETYNDPNSMSNKCAVSCIDLQRNFCPNSEFTGGYCCDKEDSNCPKASICSLDNPRAPFMFMYLSCPNEAACGTKELKPSYDGTVLTR